LAADQPLTPFVRPDFTQETVRRRGRRADGRSYYVGLGVISVGGRRL